MPDDPWVFTVRAQPITFAAQEHLPAIYRRREYVVDGGLMSYGLDISWSRRRVTVFVGKILNGMKPAEIPIERQPTVLDLAVNVRTAAALGVTIPPDVATQVTIWFPESRDTKQQGCTTYAKVAGRGAFTSQVVCRARADAPPQ